MAWGDWFPPTNYYHKPLKSETVFTKTFYITYPPGVHALFFLWELQLEGRWLKASKYYLHILYLRPPPPDVPSEKRKNLPPPLPYVPPPAWPAIGPRAHDTPYAEQLLHIPARDDDHRCINRSRWVAASPPSLTPSFLIWDMRLMKHVVTPSIRNWFDLVLDVVG